jgi:hypothetical protein
MRMLFAKFVRYGSDKSADPFPTHYPFSILNIDLRSGLDKIFRAGRNNAVSCDFLVAWSEVDF